MSDSNDRRAIKGPQAEARLLAQLWIIRHGESAGNVARDAALRMGAARTSLTERDIDVPLSIRGGLPGRLFGPGVRTAMHGA
jgi:hypothetical protein